MKGFHDLSEKFWDKVNALLAKVLVERAQGKTCKYICDFILQILETQNLSYRIVIRETSVGRGISKILKDILRLE